ncbi:MAG: CBS domain-containing protein [Hyphomicrobiales bacterium]|nr:CBS domain-containing protein [Hyphomicrobiales bacterium]
MTDSKTARDFMATKLMTLTPETDIHQAMRLLLDNRLSGAPVVNGEGKLVGVLSKKDCLKVAFSASYHKEWGGPVANYMSRDVQTVEADTDIVEVAEIFLRGPYRRFPVMENGRLVGQISRHDVLRALDELW